MQKKHLFWIIALGVTISLAFVPTSYEHIIREGTDEFRAHHALYGKKEKQVSAIATSEIREVGLVLVNLRRAPTIAPVRVTVTSQTGAQIVQTRQLSAFVDDEFTWFAVPSRSISRDQEFTVAVSAPDAAPDAPIGVRFFLEDNQLALAVRERIHLWEQVARWGAAHPRRASDGFAIIGGAALAMALLLCLDIVSRINRRYSIAITLLLLTILVLLTRIPISNSLESAFGGDAFNYLMKSRAWITGEDPFAADLRKAPLYPFLIAPGLLPFLDPVLWARGISIVSSLGTVVFVVLLLLRVGVSVPIAALSGALLAVNRDYQFETVQGLSNPLYGFLVIAAAYAFVCQRTYLVSVSAALAVITRFEGTLVAAILVPASWIIQRIRMSAFLRSLIPFFVIGLLPFTLFPFTGNLGVRTFSDIQSDEGLYLAHTWEYFEPSVKALRLIFGRLWILTEHVGNPLYAYGIGVCIGIAGVLFFRRFARPRTALAIIPALLCVAMLSGILLEFENQQKFFIWLFSCIAGAGLGGAGILKPKIAIPLAAMIFLQVLLVTAILPKNRYYIQCIPFIAMSVGVAAYAMGGANAFGKLPRALSIFFMSLVVFFVYQDAARALSGQISDYNEKSSAQTVLLHAARSVRHFEGVVAVPENGDLIMRTYLPRERVVILSDSIRNTDAQLALLHEKNIAYIIHTSENPYFTNLIAEMPEKFEKVETYTTKWGDDIAIVYRLNRI